MKRINIVTMGSRGDIQPFVALGMGLQRAGYRVTITTQTEFEKFVTDRGLGFFPTVSGALEAMKATIRFGRNPVRFLHTLDKFVRPIEQQLRENVWRSCLGADALICDNYGIYAYHAAEKLDIPVLRAYGMPMDRTRAFPAIMAPQDVDFSGSFNLMSHRLSEQFRHHFSMRIFKPWRQELGLPHLSRFRYPYYELNGQLLPTLYSYSPLVLPKPDDWGEHIDVTGYWFLDEAGGYSPPKRLLDFLAAGPPPVYIGFGSMAGDNFEYLTNVVLESLANTGRRGVLLKGWGGLAGAHMPDNVLQLDSAPHDWLFPRMAAVVHHGGAGTTGAGLRAGVPSIIIPFAWDQSLWGQRIKELGVGPDPIPRKKLTVERLTEAIRIATSDESMQARAIMLSQKIQDENGVQNAVDIIDRYLETWQHDRDFMRGTDRFVARRRRTVRKVFSRENTADYI